MSTENLPSETGGTAAPETKVPGQWNIPQEALELAWRVNMDILKDPKSGARNKMAASAQIKSMVDSNIKIAELNDKIERLDAGSPTEITDSLTLGQAAQDLAAQLEQITQPRKVVETVEPERIESDDEARR